jgi:hypothetical protein
LSSVLPFRLATWADVAHDAWSGAEFGVQALGTP